MNRNFRSRDRKKSLVEGSPKHFYKKGGEGILRNLKKFSMMFIFLLVYLVHWSLLGVSLHKQGHVSRVPYRWFL